MTEEKEVKQRFREHADEVGLCTGFKVFTLGSHGTCYVGCGLHKGHEKQLDLPDTNEFIEAIDYHQAVQTDDDGAQVIFRWPV